MKVIFNYATRQFESMEPTLRDRFQLGGRVNYAKGTPFQITDDVLEQIDNLIKNTNLNLKEIGKRIGFGTETRGMTINSPVMKKYIEKYGRPEPGRIKPSKLANDPAYIKSVVDKVKELGSKRAAAAELKIDRKTINNILKQNAPELMKPENVPGEVTSAKKAKTKALENIKIAEKKAGVKTTSQANQVISQISDFNEPYKNMSAKDLAKDKNFLNRLRMGINVRTGEVNYTGYTDARPVKGKVFTDLELAQHAIKKAKAGELFTADHIIPKALKKQNVGYPINFQPATYIENSNFDNARNYVINNPDGDTTAIDNYLKKNNQTLRFPEQKIKLGYKGPVVFESKKGTQTLLNLAKGITKGVAKKIPAVSAVLGVSEVAKAAEFTKDPRDLAVAFNTSAEVAAKQKAIREDETGELLKEEIANLPEITTDDQVAGALMDSFPNQSFLQYQSAVDDGFQGSFEEYLQQQSMKMASGGRVGFKDGTPDPFVDQALAALESPSVADQFIKQNSPSVGEMVFGKEGDRTLVQSFNTQFLDPRAFPYYGAKTLEGVTRIPEYMIRTIPALGDAVAGAIQGRPQVLQDLIKNLSPEFTDKLQKDFGLKKLIQDLEKDRTSPQKITGGLLELGGEIPGPVTPFILFKQFPKLKKQLEDLVGTGKAMEQVNREIEKKGAVDQTRRDIVLSIGAGGAVGLLKYLGLDSLFKVAPKAVEKAAPIVTKGGTPKYFFDFVSLIKKKGDDITEEAATLERQKVYDYNGYTLTEDISTGKITINKNTEGMGTFTRADGESEAYDTLVKEQIEYNPPETIINDKGKSVEVPDSYDEMTLGRSEDAELGLDSIDEILELLAKDGKTYSKEELTEMGLNVGSSNIFRFIKNKKAGGGIVKLAGADSGPPPKSGPTPHGLPYVAKNVRPIKERK